MPPAKVAPQPKDTTSAATTPVGTEKPVEVVTPELQPQAAGSSGPAHPDPQAGSDQPGEGVDGFDPTEANAGGPLPEASDPEGRTDQNATVTGGELPQPDDALSDLVAVEANEDIGGKVASEANDSAAPVEDAEHGTQAEGPAAIAADEFTAPDKADDPNAWPDLEPSLTGAAPNISTPLYVLPTPLADFIRSVAKGVAAWDGYAMATLLGVVASAMGISRVGRAAPEWVITPVIWMLLVGDSSAGKTAPMGRILKPYRTAEFDARAAHRARGQAGPDVALRERLLEIADEQGDALATGQPAAVGPPPQFMCQDMTLPGIEPIAQNNPRGVLITRDEIPGLLKTKDPQLRTALLSAYDAGTYRRTTAKGQVDIQRFGLWIIGGIQPDILTPLLDNLAEDGFGARFLPVVGAAVSLDEMGTKVDDGPMENILRWLLALEMDEGPLGPEPREVAFSEEAQKLIFRRSQMSRTQIKHETGLMAGVMGKSSGTIARFAMILAFLRAAAGTQEEPEVIDAQDVLDAATLFDDFFAPMARAAYGLQSCTPLERAARKLIQLLKGTGGSTISVRALRRMAGTGFNKGDDFLELLIWLERKGVLRWLGADAPGPQGGAPSPKYAVHPQIWQREL
jgi:hypothetical protein